MKPLHLNLAARPYRDYRPVYAVVVISSLLIAFLAFNNFDTWLRYRTETKSTRDEIARIERLTATERQRRETINRQIASIDLVSLSKESTFVNKQLAERAFSWSELLDDLEHVLPADVRITSVSPTFADNGVVQLTLPCEGKAADSMLNTIRRLQADPRFANPFPNSEEQSGTGYRFAITVDYKPSAPKVVAK